MRIVKLEPKKVHREIGTRKFEQSSPLMKTFDFQQMDEEPEDPDSTPV
jgi:hypothetical protein